MVNPTWEKIKEPVTGFAGAGTGLVVSDLAAEYTARATGQTGYKKAGVKTLVKLAIGLLLTGISMRVSGSWVLFTQVAAYTSWGSTILDWIAARIPGGIEGIANSLAITTRKWAMGSQKVAAELARLEARSRPLGVGDLEITTHNPVSSVRVADGMPPGTGPSLTPSYMPTGVQRESIPFKSKVF